MQRFDSSKDYYKILGVAEAASAEEIEKAFRNQARRRHPDGGGTEEAMKSLNEAHDILSDTETRKAYDAERNPPVASYGSSMAFYPESPPSGETLRIPVSDEDLAGLVMSAATCFGVGLPLLFLVETQWVFFLWPLRLIALGALGLGVFMSHAALKAKHRKMRELDSSHRTRIVLFHELVFWTVTAGGTALIAAYYFA